MATHFGFNFPFYSESSVLSFQTDERLIKNDLKQLLLTSLGERVMRLNFGTLIRQIQFDPNDEETIIALSNSIRAAIDRFEPRVKYRTIDVVTNPDKGIIEIHVFASLTREPNRVLSVELGFNVNRPISQPQQAV